MLLIGWLLELDTLPLFLVVDNNLVKVTLHEFRFVLRFVSHQRRDVVEQIPNRHLWACAAP